MLLCTTTLSLLLMATAAPTATLLLLFMVTTGPTTTVPLASTVTLHPTATSATKSELSTTVNYPLPAASPSSSSKGIKFLLLPSVPSSRPTCLLLTVRLSLPTRLRPWEVSCFPSVFPPRLLLWEVSWLLLRPLLSVPLLQPRRSALKAFRRSSLQLWQVWVLETSPLFLSFRQQSQLLFLPHPWEVPLPQKPPPLFPHLSLQSRLLFLWLRHVKSSQLPSLSANVVTKTAASVRRPVLGSVPKNTTV
ncbi:hypothetical protein HPB47_021641 [Ixodes persulcatus]|uniref:Uncharacterized protein n=1 Tax=Ixodes persulcatus TaxID=34615 RepID=A0AC60QF66_IXOPE|nr:hypothetical protein HPB47_021641 [Ixodes persulcatus]